jgi:uncharacterized protein (TIGR03000 family)
MYSLVLMTALATAPEMPNCGWKCGCHGGGYGHGCHGCYGGYGGCYGGCYGGYGCTGCWGGYGCGGCWGVPVAPGAVMPAKPAEPVAPPKPADGKQGAAPVQGKLLVELPEDARLYVDDQHIQTPAGRRTFNTPVLSPGQSYYYMVRMEVDINGKTHQETKQVIVRAGQTAEVTFPQLLAVIKQNKTVTSAQ